MKFRSFRVAALSALVLTGPLLTFAAGQPKLHRLDKSEMQDLSGAPPAVQQGKGTGITRSQMVSRANDYHLATAKELPAPGDESAALQPRWSDSAFRK